MKKPSKRAAAILIIAVVIIVVFAVFAILGSDTSDVVQVKTTKIQRQTVEETLELRAVLEGTESIEVQSAVHAEVLQLHVKEGDLVEAGQLLATLNTSDIEKELTQLSNDIELQQLQLNEAIEEKQREYILALTELETAEKYKNDISLLLENGIASEKEMKDAEYEWKKAVAAVNTYTVSDGVVVASAAERQAIANAQAELAVSLERLEDCEIRSQIAGTVTRVYTRVGRFADDTEDDKPMFVIENMDSLQMEVMVSESDIGSIELGQTAEITADILNGDSVAGVVERISPTGELKEGSASERVVPVLIRVTESHPRLMAGLSAKAEILLKKSENTLAVPFEAIGIDTNGTESVFRVEADGTVSIIPVTVGAESDLMAEIQADALEEGDILILNPDPELTAGTVVQPE